MRSVTRNALWLLAGEVLTRLLGFFVTVLLARRLGADGFGQVGFGVSVMSYGVIVTKFGLLTVGIREVAGDRDSLYRLVDNMLPLRFLLGLLACIGIVAFAFLARHDSQSRLLLALFGSGVIIQTLLLEWVFNGIERMEYVALAHVLTNATYLGLIGFLVRSPASLLVVPLAFAAGTLVAALVLLVAYARGHGWPRPRFDREVWMRLGTSSWPLGIASVLNQFYVNFGIVGLALLRTDSEAGEFTAAHRLLFFLLMTDRILQAVFLPVISRNLKAAQHMVPELAGAAIRVALGLSLPVCAAVVLLAGPVTGLVFGPQYQAAVRPLTVLVWFFPLSLLSTVFGYALVAACRELEFLRNNAIAVGVALAFSLIAIPRAGVMGAAWAMLAGEGVMLGLMLSGGTRLLKPRLEWRLTMPFAASLLLAVIVLALRNWNWPAAAVAGSLAAAGLLFATGSLTAKDLGLVR